MNLTNIYSYWVANNETFVINRLMKKYDLYPVQRELIARIHRSVIYSTLFDARDFTRQSGKTHCLISYAKEYNLPVIVGSINYATALRRRYDYDNIYSAFSIGRGYYEPSQTILIDELGATAREHMNSLGVRLAGIRY